MGKIKLDLEDPRSFTLTNDALRHVKRSLRHAQKELKTDDLFIVISNYDSQIVYDESGKKISDGGPGLQLGFDCRKNLDHNLMKYVDGIEIYFYIQTSFCVDKSEIDVTNGTLFVQ